MSLYHIICSTDCWLMFVCVITVESQYNLANILAILSIIAGLILDNEANASIYPALWTLNILWSTDTQLPAITICPRTDC